MKLFPVFSRKVARKLQRRGFQMVTSAPNRIYPEKTVYYFEETSMLRQAVDELVRRK